MRTWFRRLAYLFRRSRHDAELREEIEVHRSLRAAQLQREGLTSQEAADASRRAVGNALLAREEAREVWLGSWDTWWQDVRYSLRIFRKGPGFTATVVATLALGIGANAAIFHLIDTIRLRSLAIANPHELAEVSAGGPQAFGIYDGVNSKATYPLWELIHAHQNAFSTMFAWGDAVFLVGRGVEARRARGLWVSGDFFRALGIAPERGRLLDPDDDRAGCGARSAVVSHSFWQTYFGGGESAIGSTVTLLGQPFTVVGVTPASFTGLEVGKAFDVALPVCSAALWDARLDQRDRWWLTIMGRLERDWTIARANEHLRTLSPGFLDATIPPGYEAGFIDGYRRLRFGVFPAGRGVSRLRDVLGTSLWLLLALTGLVLLIVCANLATLTLARGSARGREIAVRVAIGASRARLVSQMLIETLLLAAGGAALAVPVALISGRALVAFLDTSTAPITLPLTADWRLVTFVGAVATLATVLFGLLPALRVSMADPLVAMRQASRGLTLDRHRARFQRGLVIAQVAVSLLLVFSALLFVQTFRNRAAVDTGFNPDQTVVVFEGRASQDLTSEIRSAPGVAAAAASTHVPLSGDIWSHFFRVTSAAGNERKASRFAYVSPGYFDTLQIPIRSGRDFTDLDNARSRHVVVVNESFVRSHLDGLTPIGTTLRRLEEPGFPETTYEIIGVVADTKYAELRDENCWCDVAGGSRAPIAYVPIAQNPSPYAWTPVIVRSSTTSAGIASTIAQRVARLNPAIGVEFIELKTRIRERLVGERMIAWLAGAFGILALTLVAIGLYAIIAYLAVGRRHEIGIRLSLGSTRAQIMGLVLRDNLWLMGIGLALGLPLALGAMHSAGALLFGLTPMDVPTVSGATFLIVSAGLLAGAFPAWRAARIRLDEALRCD